MEYVIAALLFICSAILAIILSVFANHLYDTAPSLARRIIDHAVKRLPPTERERCREEWYADNENWIGGNLGKLHHAAGCLFGARTIRKVHASAIASKDDVGVHRPPRNQLQTVETDDHDKWELVFESDLEEIKRIVPRHPQPGSERLERRRDGFWIFLDDVNDSINSDGEIIDTFLDLMKSRTTKGDLRDDK
jgi:hypothetical protein